MTKRLTKFSSYLLTFILGAAIGAGAYGIADNLSSKKLDDDHISTEQPGGLILPDETEGKGVKLVSTAIPAEQFADYAVPLAAESAFTLTATITPADATIQTGKFTMAFENDSSEWATGKQCSDYISMQQSGLQATISCLEAFGERIIVTFKSDDEACDKTASCTLEYKKKYLGFDIGVHFVTKEEVNSGTDPSTFSYTEIHDGEFIGTAIYLGSPSTRMMAFNPSGAKFSESYTKDDSSLNSTVNLTLNMTEDFKSLFPSLAQTAHDFKINSNVKNISLNVMGMIWGSSTFLTNSTVLSNIKQLQGLGKHPFVLKIEHPSSGSEYKYYFDLDTTNVKSVQNVELNETTHDF